MTSRRLQDVLGTNLLGLFSTDYLISKFEITFSGDIYTIVCYCITASA